MTINLKAILTIAISFVVFRLFKSKVFYIVSFGAIVADDLPSINLPINTTFIIAIIILLVIGFLLLVLLRLLFKKVSNKYFSKAEKL